MKKNQSKGNGPHHQTVTEEVKFESAGRSIKIEFTDQQLSPHAGTATFWSFVQASGLGRLHRLGSLSVTLGDWLILPRRLSFTGKKARHLPVGFTTRSPPGCGCVRGSAPLPRRGQTHAAAL